jgi:hypothetical protein
VTTLHEELAGILRDNGNRWMTTEELAAEVNERGAYAKRDGSAVTAFQVHGRTRNYRHMFERDGSRARLLDEPSEGLEVSTVPRRAGARRPPTPIAPAPTPVIALPDAVLEALSASAASPVARADVPGSRGLYAVHGAGSVWRDLGLGDPPDERPLYIGKAEDSLVARDIRTHFSSGRTGSSTLRRSLAALLTDKLDLAPKPRNPDRPGYFANYGLEPDSDGRLTTWMRKRLAIATWTPPADEWLDSVETLVLEALKPPLNLAKIATPWTATVSAARTRMAARARAWRR